MAIEDLFRFVSAEERKQKEAEYLRKIFPLGISQRDAALKALRPLINPKITDTDILFAVIMSKQKYIDNFGNAELSLQKHISGLKLFNVMEKKCLMALVLLDANVKSLEEYPVAEDIEAAVNAADWTFF